MSTTDTCTSPTWESRGGCLAALAGGWITPSDLCPYDTRRFMAALDAVEPGLVWHDGFRGRAVAADEPICSVCERPCQGGTRTDPSSGAVQCRDEPACFAAWRELQRSRNVR